MSEFEVNDIVSFGGAEGVVEEITGSGNYPVFCKFKFGVAVFTLDGKYSVDHTEPLLKLVRKAKKPKRVLYQWVCKFDGDWYSLSYFYETEEALRNYIDDRKCPVKRLDYTRIEVDEE